MPEHHIQGEPGEGQHIPADLSNHAIVVASMFPSVNVSFMYRAECALFLAIVIFLALIISEFK